VVVSEKKYSEPLGAAASPSAALPGVRVGDEAQGSGDAPQKATELAAARSSLPRALLNGLRRRRGHGHAGFHGPPHAKHRWVGVPVLSNPLAGRRGFSFRGSGSIYLRAAISFFRRVGLGPEAGSAYWSC